MNYTLMVVQWLIVLVPGGFLYLINREYRGILHGRRLEISSIMSRGETFAKYLEAYRSSSDSHKRTIDQTVDSLFYRRYGRSKYYLPLAMNALFGGLFLVILFLRSGFHMGIPVEIENGVHKLPVETIAGLAGAFVWGLYEILRRYDAVDLSPVNLHLIWLRMLLASIIAPLFSALFANSLKPGIAFAIGAFPIKDLLDFVKGQARKQLNLTGSTQPAEPPSLFRIQGLSEGMLNRLLDEGVESVAQVAMADPIKLLMTTNIEWKTILDIIDQAILFGYFSEKTEQLRSFGIRGAIELATLQRDLSGRVAHIRQEAEQLVSAISLRIGEDKAGIKNAIRNAYEDVQVEFLWDLWGET